MEQIVSFNIHTQFTTFERNTNFKLSLNRKGNCNRLVTLSTWCNRHLTSSFVILQTSAIPYAGNITLVIFHIVQVLQLFVNWILQNKGGSKLFFPCIRLFATDMTITQPCITHDLSEMKKIHQLVRF